MFDPVDPRQALPAMEEGILQYWKEEDIFRRSVKERENAAVFSFYDGPPFATGLPHYGHLLAGTIKDVIPRYQTMCGKKVDRRFGWDCHGLPVENLIEKEQKITGYTQILDMGVQGFNELCCASVQRYTKEWREIVERMGRWVDMDWDYRTMDPEYMESIWWVFSQLHEKGLIYEGHKPMHICPRCVTPLSNFEVTQAYQDVTDHAVTVKFALTDEPDTFILAWTTTPWTLPGNLFLAVDPKMRYVKIRTENGEIVIFAQDVFERAAEENAAGEIVEVLTGKDLLGKQYRPLFPYFMKQYSKTAFRVVAGDFVTSEDGTGVVHIAPGFGEDDYAIGKREGVEILQHVTMEGRFVDAVADFAGEEVKPADDPGRTDRKVIAWLEKNGLLFSQEKHKHSYPHCWRCDAPLLNYATSSWFVAVETMKEELLDANAKTEWVPAHVRDGRFGKWLEGARDWAISRNRFWGTPIPIWRCEETGEMDVLRSRNDLMQRAPERFTKITALRHAESEGNLIPMYQEKEPGTDLTERGREQARRAAARLSRFPAPVPHIIYCSPLARTQQTAQAVAEQIGADIIVDNRLREVCFGEYEGKTVDFSDLSFIKARRAHKLETNAPESIYHFPGMETWSQVQKRIRDFMQDTLPRHRGEHILVVTHADPIQSIVHYFMGTDPLKLSHQPYPKFATPYTFYWDHKTQQQMDLHKHSIDDITWDGASVKGKNVEATFVRHGETDWNAEHKIQGGTDTALNENGKKQAADAARKLKKRSFDILISSGLARARETADILSNELGIPLAEQWEEFNERNFGAWEGKRRAEVMPDAQGQIAVQELNCPQAESLGAFLGRVDAGLEKLRSAYPGKRVLIVAHGGVLKAAKVLTGEEPLAKARTTFIENGEQYTCTLTPLLRRIPDVFDCWFESGSMPYGQSHFPFEEESEKPLGFPADFIAEGMDQTRGWFYTLLVLSTALFKEPAFRHCVVNGIVLAEDGKKMSKRLKNYPEPMELVEQYGADAVRFTLMRSPAVRGEDLRFSAKMVEETMRNVLLPLWNAYSFFVTYANAAQYEPAETRRESSHPLDVWIRAEVQDLANRMTEELDRYDLAATCEELNDTIDALTNWYIRLSRRRFAGKASPQSPDASPASSIEGAGEEERTAALHTLYDVLLTISQLLAPFCPFLSDALYLNLVSEEHSSVHLTDWPQTRSLSAEEEQLLAKTRLMRRIVSLGHKIRSQKALKVRQPLRKAIVAVPPALQEACNLSDSDLELMRQELNVKELAFASDPGELADIIVRVDARAVGPRLGKRVQEVIQAGKRGDFTQREDGTILILEEELTPAEADIVYLGREGTDVAADHGIVVSVDTAVDGDLEREGLARDLIRTIQRLRKEAGLSFTDEITLSIEGAEEVLAAFGELISQETRAHLAKNNGEKQMIDLEGKQVTIAFEKR